VRSVRCYDMVGIYVPTFLRKPTIINTSNPNSFNTLIICSKLLFSVALIIAINHHDAATYYCPTRPPSCHRICQNVVPGSMLAQEAEMHHRNGTLIISLLQLLALCAPRYSCSVRIREQTRCRLKILTHPTDRP
jgi:hypothetical protein